MAKVFVPHIPSRFDSASRLWIPTINIDPAKKYGEIISMLPPSANRVDLKETMRAMRERLADFSREDYLAAVGDPTLYAAAACLACSATGGFLRMLKWDRIANGYVPVEFSL